MFLSLSVPVPMSWCFRCPSSLCLGCASVFEGPFLYLMYPIWLLLPDRVICLPKELGDRDHLQWLQAFSLVKLSFLGHGAWEAIGRTHAAPPRCSGFSGVGAAWLWHLLRRTRCALPYAVVTNWALFPRLGTRCVGEVEGRSANKFHGIDAVLQSWVSLQH